MTVNDTTILDSFTMAHLMRTETNLPGYKWGGSGDKKSQFWIEYTGNLKRQVFTGKPTDEPWYFTKRFRVGVTAGEVREFLAMIGKIKIKKEQFADAS